MNFAETYPLHFIIGAEFNEGEINEWMANNHKWDSSLFLLEKILARAVSLPTSTKTPCIFWPVVDRLLLRARIPAMQLQADLLYNLNKFIGCHF